MIWDRFRVFMRVFDDRFEDLERKNWKSIVYRDFSAGLIVAMTAIPMAMGFAIAMGLRPEQGIIAGALACIIGRTFGGSKYQVYGPTAAFIPVIAGLMAAYGPAGGGTFEQGHGFLVLCSIIAGICLMFMGLFGLGKYAKLVPNSIIVGFTVGIAIVIAMSNFGEALGLQLGLKGGMISKVREIAQQFSDVNYYAFGLALLTFFLTRFLLKISVFIPAPLIALGVGTMLAAFVLGDKNILLIKDRFGSIPTDDLEKLFAFTGPIMPEWTIAVYADIAYFAFAIVFVSAVESILCSSMADRLADNRKTLFNPEKELWGQGLVQVITPLINGFPCTGALARTATSIKAGAVTPLAGYFKGVLKLIMAFFLADYLDEVPMACIAGILLWVASNMIKFSEIREVWHHHWFHAALMIYTAVMVPLTDFLTGVMTALILYFILRPFLDRRPGEPTETGAKTDEPTPSEHVRTTEPWRPHMQRHQRTLVALSGTETDVSLIRYARMLAEHGFARHYDFVHVHTPSEAGTIQIPESNILRVCEERVGSLFGTPREDVASSCHVLAGLRLDNLVDYAAAQKCDLVLLGHRKSRSGQRSLARRMAMIAPCSVWMVPEDAPISIKRIMAPIDFSDHSADSLVVAASIAKGMGLEECLASHVYFDASFIRYDEHIEEMVRSEEENFRKFITPLDLHGVNVKPVFTEGNNVAGTILYTAEQQGADLIVMNTRGRSQTAAILLGSVTTQVMIETPISLLAVKHYGAMMNLFEVLQRGEFWSQSSTKTN